MSVYYTDRVQITPVAVDQNFRTETEGASFFSEAYIEDDDKIVYDSTGQPIKPAKRIFLPYINKNKNIEKGDLIKVTERFGKAVVEKAVQINLISLIGSFVGDQWEIII